MKGRRHAELAALLPYRVVVVCTVDPDHVEPTGKIGRLGAFGGNLLNGPLDQTVHGDGLEAQLTNGVLELCDRLLRIMHRNDGSRCHAVLERIEQLRTVRC